MFWSSIILFFVMIFSLGYSITYFIKKKDDILERNLMNLGFGLAAFAVLSVFLNLIRIKLHWFVFLAISLVVPIWTIYKQVSKEGFKFKGIERIKELKITKSDIYILCVLVIFFVFFGVYHSGAFKYPYLEDDDPWFHAETAKYISIYKTFSYDPSVDLKYTEPYPPAYATLMGVLHQTNTKIIWSLKFFNVLLISLGLIFFYFFAKEFFDSRKKALFSTFLLALIPCFLSHFIWASSLAIVLFFPAFYSVEKLKEDMNWWIVCAICIAGILLSQPSNAAIFGIMFIFYWLCKVLATKSFQKYVFFAGLVGLLSAFLVFYLPVIIKFGWVEFSSGIGFGSTSLLHFAGAESGGGLLYAWNDFMIAKTSSKMDNPVGVGIFLFFLMIFSLIFCLYKIFSKPKKLFSKDNFQYIMIVLWLIFGFAGIHGNRLPVQLMPHRFWAIFAIPVVLIASEGFFALGKISEKLRIPRFFIYAVIIVGILITSGYPKYKVETSYWPPGVNWGSMEEVSGYMNIVGGLPDNTKVFPLCSHSFKVLSFDKLAEPWDPEYDSFKKQAFNVSVDELKKWLKKNGYSYMTMDTYCLRKHSQNETIDKFESIRNNTGFNLEASGNGVFLFRVL